MYCRRVWTAHLEARSARDSDWKPSSGQTSDPRQLKGEWRSSAGRDASKAENAGQSQSDDCNSVANGASRGAPKTWSGEALHPYGILERAVRSFRTSEPAGSRAQDTVDEVFAKQPGAWETPPLSSPTNEGLDAADALLANDASMGGSFLTLPQTTPKRVFPWDTTTGVIGLSHFERQVAFYRRRQRLLQQAYKECGRITSIFAKTFYLGTLFLPKRKRDAIWAVYVWCRRTDDLVDGPRVRQRDASLRQKLSEWESRLEQVWAGYPQDALDLALADTVRNYPGLRIDPFRDMIQGMLMDVDRARYETFDELYLYCYRVAGTVGLMALPILGVDPEHCKSEAEAVESALALGIALQLTNILRDVGEDALRGRVYLPQEEMRYFGYTEDELFASVVNDRYQELIKFQIARVRAYYRTAECGIAKLHPSARLPIRASLDMYRQILDAIEENDFDNFHRRAYVSKLKKALTLPVSCLRVQETEGTWLGRLWGPFDRGFIQRPNV